MTDHLILKNVKKNFGSSEIIRNANLNVKKGEIHSLIGPNGAGKSTLYNLISGVYSLTSGTIEYNKKTISGLESHQIYRLGLARSFQITNIFHKLSVFENIRCSLLWSKNFGYSIFQFLDNKKLLTEKTIGPNNNAIDGSVPITFPAKTPAKPAKPHPNPNT